MNLFLRDEYKWRLKLAETTLYIFIEITQGTKRDVRSDGKVDQGEAIRRMSRDPFGNGYIHSDQDDQEWKVQQRAKSLRS